MQDLKNTLKSSSTVKRAREEVGRAISQPNVEEQIRTLNLIRQWAYANQQELGLDLSLTFCARVECFCDPCPTCPDQPLYRGIRLPNRFQSIETVRLRNDHVPVFSAWRLPYDGVSGYPNDGSVKLFDNGWAATERDFVDCCPKHVRFWSEHCSDKCQTMRITGETDENREETFEYQVTRDPQVTDQKFRKIHTVVFCNGVSGRVILAQEDGVELARYSAGQTVPQYREYRIYGGCDPKQLVIVANCNYADVVDDCDLVEFGNPLVWQLLAKATKEMDKGEMDGNDRANLQFYLASAAALMKAQSSVDMSETIGARFRRAPIKGSRLSDEFYHSRRY